MNIRRGILQLVRFSSQKCRACGAYCRYSRGKAIVAELARDWDLNKEQVEFFDEREGAACRCCGSSRRAERLAIVLTDEISRASGIRSTSLAAAVKTCPTNYRVAEINAAGALHQFLTRIPGLSYSEYGSFDVTTPSESLADLSYGDSEFDLVVTSETLEHIPDVDLALKEILRVLKPGGAHIFTVPILLDRMTRQRASVQNGVLIEHLPPSYHGSYAERHDDQIVFHEFGRDFPERVRAAGSTFRSLRMRESNLVVFVSHKPLK